jgi:hypothetical protein
MIWTDFLNRIKITPTAFVTSKHSNNDTKVVFINR